MVTARLKYIILFVGIFLSLQSFGQRHVFTEVKTKTSKVYVGEPAEITLTVYTSTWFTKGLDVPNIKVEDAFTVKFRSLSVSKNIDGQTYAGVQFIYHVFPYNEEDVEFPAMIIEVETPDKGDYVGKKRKVNSRAIPIKVIPIPPGFEKKDWLVTSSLIVRDNWQGDLNNVKVGDVLERSIYRKAEGTVSELIPPIEWDTIQWVSFYPERGTVKTNKARTTFDAERTDVMRYLLEKEGEVVIPEMTLLWWNAQRMKIYKKTLPEVVLHVQANPDLGMIESIKDSLAGMEAEMTFQETDEEPFIFLGMNWKQLSVAIVLFFFALKYLIRLMEWIWKTYKTRRTAYFGSERYFFHQFLKALSKDEVNRRNDFYRWIDCLDLKEYSLHYFGNRYMKNQSDLHEVPKDKWLWIKARKQYFKGQNAGNDLQWINP